MSDCVAIGPGSCAVGNNAVAVGAHAVAIRCACGLDLAGRAAVGQAEQEATSLYRDHATRCPLAIEL